MNSINDNLIDETLEKQNDLESIDNISELNIDDDKFNALYKKSFKQSIASDKELVDIDQEFLKKIRNKRIEIVSLKRRIDSNDSELKKALDAFNEVYYQDVDDEVILDTKDKALAQKTLFYRKSARDADQKLINLDKDNKDAIRNNELGLVEYKKAFTQNMMDLDRKMKVEIQKARNAKKEEEIKLNNQLSESNTRSQINAINEYLGNIKKELLAIIKDIKIKYLNLRKEEELKNVLYLFENEKQNIQAQGEFERNKASLEFQKREAEIEYDSESKTYVLALKRANNNLKKDLILRKNGVITNITDLNKDLYEKITLASIELIELQNEFNAKVIDSIIDSDIERMKLVLGKSHDITNQFNSDVSKLNSKGSSAFVKSLKNVNDLKQENLARVVNLEIDELVDNLRNAYFYNAKADYGYKHINDSVIKSFGEYKKEVYEKLNAMNALSQKLSKDCLKRITYLPTELKTVVVRRGSLYRNLMEKINNVIINFASGIDEEASKYKDEAEIRRVFKENEAKLYIEDFTNANDEIEAINVKHEEVDKQLDLEVSKFNSEIAEKRKELEKDKNSKESIIQDEINVKLGEIQAKYDSDVSEVENKYKEMLKELTGDYKTENKLL